MNLKFLGDKKDEFKWDYLDFLTESLGVLLLDIVLMPTRPEEKKPWESSEFPAGEEIRKFREELWKRGNFGFLRALPNYTGAGYTVELHREGECFAFACAQGDRAKYFSDLACCDKSQVVFLDPDTGFSSSGESGAMEYVVPSDIEQSLGQIAGDSVVVIFQHRNRDPAEVQFCGIKTTLPPCHATAFYCSHLMFIAAGRDKGMIDQVRAVNQKYEEVIVGRRRKQGRGRLTSGVIG